MAKYQNMKPDWNSHCPDAVLAKVVTKGKRERKRLALHKTMHCGTSYETTDQLEAKVLQFTEKSIPPSAKRCQGLAS